MNPEQKEKQLLAMLLFSLDKNYRPLILNNTHEEIARTENAMKHVDPTVYDSFRAAAKADESKFLKATTTFEGLSYAAMLKDEAFFADCSGNYSGEECPQPTLGVAQGLVQA